MNSKTDIYGPKIEYSTIPRNGSRSSCTKEECSVYCYAAQVLGFDEAENSLGEAWYSPEPLKFIASLSDGEWHRLPKKYEDSQNFREYARLIPGEIYDFVKIGKAANQLKQKSKKSA